MYKIQTERNKNKKFKKIIRETFTMIGLHITFALDILILFEKV